MSAHKRKANSLDIVATQQATGISTFSSAFVSSTATTDATDKTQEQRATHDDIGLDLSYLPQRLIVAVADSKTKNQRVAARDLAHASRSLSVRAAANPDYDNAKSLSDWRSLRWGGLLALGADGGTEAFVVQTEGNPLCARACDMQAESSTILAGSEGCTPQVGAHDAARCVSACAFDAKRRRLIVMCPSAYCEQGTDPARLLSYDIDAAPATQTAVDPKSTASASSLTSSSSTNSSTSVSADGEAATTTSAQGADKKTTHAQDSIKELRDRVTRALDSAERRTSVRERITTQDECAAASDQDSFALATAKKARVEERLLARVLRPGMKRLFPLSWDMLISGLAIDASRDWLLVGVTDLHTHRVHVLQLSDGSPIMVQGPDSAKDKVPLVLHCGKISPYYGNVVLQVAGDDLFFLSRGETALFRITDYSSDVSLRSTDPISTYDKPWQGFSIIRPQAKALDVDTKEPLEKVSTISFNPLWPCS